jgi:hypothetical protein
MRIRENAYEAVAGFGSVWNSHDSAEVIKQRSREPAVTNLHDVVLDVPDMPFYFDD